MNSVADSVVATTEGPVADSWEDPPRRPPETTSPVLSVEGFEGPLDWLLEMARARKLDLARLSILALVEAYVEAMQAVLTPGLTTADLAHWAGWTVMATQLVELRSRLMLPIEAPEVSISAEWGPTISVQTGPTPAVVFGRQARVLMRQLSLPVSMISQWWVRRSSSAVVILASPNTVGHSAKARLVVTITDVRS